MKKFILAILVLTGAVTGSRAQCLEPYFPILYPAYNDANITYGTADNYAGVPVTLEMNIWKPVGDNNTARPIIMWIHGGGFFGGTRAEMDSIASRYAQRGYVSASISYRLGFYGPAFFNAPFAYDSAEVIRAAYRAIQDAHGAMRFLKGRAAIDSSDINMAFVGGASAGSITALHMVYADLPSEEPPAIGAISNVQTIFTNTPRPSLGPATGSLNLNGQNSQVKAVINMFGALMRPDLISGPEDVPLFSYHQTGDPTVGCDFNIGLWGMPFNVSQNYPHLYGSCAIDPYVTSIGYTPTHYQSLLYNGNAHGLHNEVLVDSLIARFLSDIICEQLTSAGNELQGNSFALYPNPAKEIISVKLEKASSGDLMITDIAGKIISRETFINADALAISVNDMAPGVYFACVHSEHQSSVVRFVKN